ncbi:MAG: LUD domain-containing protein [Verrucomicrobiales bacterium]|nr:LUD domain-containing protein [Verrucomicrobiales bacterium]
MVEDQDAAEVVRWGVSTLDEGAREELGMKNDEDTVKLAVKEALLGLGERAVLPEYDSALLLSARHKGSEQDGWTEFAENFSAVSGKPMQEVTDLVEFLKEGGFGKGYCDPELKQAVGEVLVEAGLQVSYEFDHQRVDDYVFGITKASGVIAESGTVILNDEDTVDRLAALAPWVHVAVLTDQKKVFANIPQAIENLGGSSNVIWVTGPSKTADIEGILIEGVHGPGVQICLRIGEGK